MRRENVTLCDVAGVVHKGRTEEIVGTWVEKSGRRAEVVIATKICGPNPGFVRDGRGIDPETVRGAVDPRTGMVMNLKDLKAAIEAVISTGRRRRDAPSVTTSARASKSSASPMPQPAQI